MTRSSDIDRNKQVSTAIFLIILLGLIFGLAGEMDKTDEENEVKHYCEMVDAGHWTNFKKVNLDEYCNG
jgi:hypothetical protein